MPEERKPDNEKADPQRDKTDRLAPALDPVEGGEETIDEDLRNQEQKRR
ncbi:MAG: hypothetical protein ACM336_22075 [Acidobacteriota bacterium]